MTSLNLTAPPADATIPGDLYVDVATRTIWLGVDTSVDPSGAVLLSDMVLNTPPNTGLPYAKLCSPEGVIGWEETLTKAQIQSADALLAPLANPVFTGNPRGPTPTTTDNDTTLATTAFVQAAIAAAAVDTIPVGMIALFSGNPLTIGTGVWANWHLCDGNAGTPNLTDKFVVGYGAAANNTGNTVANVVTELAGKHTHNITPTVLTIGQLPSHTHGPGTLKGTGDTNTAGAHVHGERYGTLGNRQPGSGDWHTVTASDFTGANTTSAGAHSHTVTVDDFTGATAAAGSNSAHDHAESEHSGHTHNILPTKLKAGINWYALAYVMKIA